MACSIVTCGSAEERVLMLVKWDAGAYRLVSHCPSTGPRQLFSSSNPSIHNLSVRAALERSLPSMGHELLRDGAARGSCSLIRTPTGTLVAGAETARERCFAAVDVAQVRCEPLRNHTGGVAAPPGIDPVD